MSTSRQPNILFVMADDHACQAIGCYGTGLNVTPNLDRIAADGIRLDHCYVTNSICTPSRAAILCGTYNHVNGVTTLNTPLDRRTPNVARHLRQGGYQTAMIGKWHLGEGPAHAPSGFDHWSVLPGQGEYFDPVMIDRNGAREHRGYVTDIITEQSLDWLRHRDPDRPFFLMCHHKAPHREWECAPRHRALYEDDLPVPPSFDDDYRNRSQAAVEARMRIRSDMKYRDLGLVQPEGGADIGERIRPGSTERRIPDPDDVSSLRLIDRDSGEVFTFDSREALDHFKYQRYIKRYLRTVSSLDEGVGRLLDWLDDAGLAENTLVIYTSDQGFFLGEHGWFDKRFIYEESFRMPFLARLPSAFGGGRTSDAMACNVDFAPTFLDYAGLAIPNYMQGRSLRPLLTGELPDDWPRTAYHRYWMHRDADHDARAHYGIRDHRYKLIHWYGESHDLPGTSGGGEAREWELFDCRNDPLELFNVHDEPAHREARERLLGLLDAHMARIGDIPEH